MSVETLTRPTKKTKSNTRSKTAINKAFQEELDALTLIELIHQMPTEDFIYESDVLEKEEYREWIWL